MALPLRPDEVHVWSTEAPGALPRVLSRYLDRPPEEIELRRDVHGHLRSLPA